MDGKKDRPFEITGLIIVLMASSAGWLLFGSYNVPAGLVAGGLIGVINFKWLGSIVKGALSEGNAARYTVKYMLKFLFIIIASASLIYSRVADPLAFLVGFTIIVATVSLKGADSIERS